VETLLAEMENDSLVGPGILSITGWLTCFFQIMWSISPGCPAQEMLDLNMSFWVIWWVTAFAGAWLLAGASTVQTTMQKMFGPHWRGSTQWLGSHVSLVLLALLLLTVFPTLVYVKQAGVSSRAAKQDASPAARHVVAPLPSAPTRPGEQRPQDPPRERNRAAQSPRQFEAPKTPGREPTP
jgi:hypothetical protein